MFELRVLAVSPGRDHDDCISVLAGLRLWHNQQLQGGLWGYTLNPIFKDKLRKALFGGSVLLLLLLCSLNRPSRWLTQS